MVHRAADRQRLRLMSGIWTMLMELRRTQPETDLFHFGINLAKWSSDEEGTALLLLLLTAPCTRHSRERRGEL